MQQHTLIHINAYQYALTRINFVDMFLDFVDTELFLRIVKYF